MNGWIGKVVGAALALAIMGIAGGITVFGQQQGIKKDVAANHEAATMCCDKAHKNETDIAVIGTKLGAFTDQYEKDQKRAADERKAILDAVKK